MTRRIKVRGVRRQELDESKLALAYWTLAKAAVESKRQRAAEDKAKRRSAREAPGGR